MANHLWPRGFLFARPERAKAVTIAAGSPARQNASVLTVRGLNHGAAHIDIEWFDFGDCHRRGGSRCNSSRPVVSRSDGGWEILREHFVAGLPPIFGLPANQVHPRLATADSLLCEANRSAADPHSTAADLMGAALVLSDMQPNYYMSRSLPDPASVGYLMWANKLPAIDVHWREGYRNMLLRARELAREATNREPGRVDWWRLSALVEFSGANRWEEWLDFSLDQKRLEDSAEHDSDNALYPYLLGYQNFRRAFELKKPMPDANSANGTTPSLPANGDVPCDFNLLETSRSWYEQGLEKPVLSSGTGSFQAAANFIAQAHGRITDKIAWLNPWLLDVNEWMLLHEICYPFEGSPLDDATDPKLVALNGWFTAHPMHARWTNQLVAGDDVNWAHDVRIKASQYQWLSTQDQEYIAAQRMVDRRNSKGNMRAIWPMPGRSARLPPPHWAGC